MTDFYGDQVRVHYESTWKSKSTAFELGKGPMQELPESFRVLRFPPAGSRAWSYATCGMSSLKDSDPMELHLHSPSADEGHVELLTAIVHYNTTGERLGLGHAINFGRPWLPGSRCDRGLISLPYLDGPGLEWMRAGSARVRFLWLIPITPQELQFKNEHGVEALELEFERASLAYLDPARASVV